MELSVLKRYLDLDRPRRILDVGSGKGAFAGKFSRAGHEVFGLDPSVKAARIARRFVDSNAKVVLGEGEAQPFSTGSFGRAVSVCVLEHTRDDSAVLAEVHRVLAPGGIFALTVDCLDSPYVSEEFRRDYAREYRCNQFYSDGKLREMLARVGFDVLETRYLFCGRLSVAILRFGHRFHFRGVFILLFPVLYPLLLLDRALAGKKGSGMILAAKARKRGS